MIKLDETQKAASMDGDGGGEWELGTESGLGSKYTTSKYGGNLRGAVYSYSSRKMYHNPWERCAINCGGID